MTEKNSTLSVSSQPLLPGSGKAASVTQSELSHLRRREATLSTAETSEDNVGHRKLLVQNCRPSRDGWALLYRNQESADPSLSSRYGEAWMGCWKGEPTTQALGSYKPPACPLCYLTVFLLLTVHSIHATHTLHTMYTQHICTHTHTMQTACTQCVYPICHPLPHILGIYMHTYQTHTSHIIYRY